MGFVHLLPVGTQLARSSMIRSLLRFLVPGVYSIQDGIARVLDVPDAAAVRQGLGAMTQ
jgi:hypothetical protein